MIMLVISAIIVIFINKSLIKRQDINRKII